LIVNVNAPQEQNGLIFLVNQLLKNVLQSILNFCSINVGKFLVLNFLRTAMFVVVI